VDRHISRRNSCLSASVDVVEPCDDMLTFILYTADDKELQRGRELQLSKARSHAAQRSYAWRKSRDPQRQLPHREDESLTVRNHPGPRPQPRRHRLTDGGRQTANRTVDWHFGSLGGSSRPVGDLDATALQFYLSQPLSQTMSTEIAKRFPQPSAKLGQWSPFLQETIQRVTRDSTALDSLVSSTVILMADNYMDNRSLMSAGRKMTGHAVSGLRNSIQENYAADPLSVQLSSMHLCLGALRAGDATAARTHLKFLEATATGLDARDPYHADVLSIFRFCDVWLALESGKAPSRVLHPRVGRENEAQLSPPKSQTSCPPDDKLNPEFPSESEQRDNSPGQMPDANALHSLKRTRSTPDRHSHPGLVEAATSELLCMVTPSLIARYANAIDSISASVQKATPTLEDFQPMLSNCMDSVLELCFAFDQVQRDLQSPQADHATTNPSPPSQTSTARRRTAFDEPVILALQMQLVLRLGKFIQRNRVTLARRLMAALTRRPHLTLARPQIENTASVLHNRLYLWVLVSGMLCAQNNLGEFSWFRSRAAKALAAMRVASEAELTAVLEPFLTAHAPFDFGFCRLAKELVGG